MNPVLPPIRLLTATIGTSVPPGSTASFHWRRRDGIVAVMTEVTAGMFALEKPAP